MTRWRERGLVSDWSKMAAIALIGWSILGGKFRLVDQPDGGKQMRLSGAHEFCCGKLCLAPFAFYCLLLFL